MIAEAIDTVVALGWALAVWIVLCAGAAALALHTILAVVWWAGRALWRGVAGVRSAVQPSRAPILLPEPPEVARARTAPSWAQPEQDAA